MAAIFIWDGAAFTIAKHLGHLVLIVLLDIQGLKYRSFLR